MSATPAPTSPRIPGWADWSPTLPARRSPSPFVPRGTAAPSPLGPQAAPWAGRGVAAASRGRGLPPGGQRGRGAMGAWPQELAALVLAWSAVILGLLAALPVVAWLAR